MTVPLWKRGALVGISPVLSSFWGDGFMSLPPALEPFHVETALATRRYGPPQRGVDSAKNDVFWQNANVDFCKKSTFICPGRAGRRAPVEGKALPSPGRSRPSCKRPPQGRLFHVAPCGETLSSRRCPGFAVHPRALWEASAFRGRRMRSLKERHHGAGALIGRDDEKQAVHAVQHAAVPGQDASGILDRARALEGGFKKSRRAAP